MEKSYERLRHFPQGKCGLKSVQHRVDPNPGQSLPAREVWIEIFLLDGAGTLREVTSRKGSVD